jgi:putative membrane protein
MQLYTNLNAGWSSLKSVGLVVPLNQAAELVLTTLIFSILGILLFTLAFWIIVKASPFSVRKEIEEDQNTALAIVIGSVILGIAVIIAAAVSG